MTNLLSRVWREYQMSLYITYNSMCAESNVTSSISTHDHPHLNMMARLILIHVCIMLCWPSCHKHRHQMFASRYIWCILIGQCSHSKCVTFRIHLAHGVQYSLPLIFIYMYSCSYWVMVTAMTWLLNCVNMICVVCWVCWEGGGQHSLPQAVWLLHSKICLP